LTNPAGESNSEARVGKPIASCLGKAESIVKLAIAEQPSIGGDKRTANLERYPGGRNRASAEAAFPPTIQRIAGSCRSPSASMTSSYPASRPKTGLSQHSDQGVSAVLAHSLGWGCAASASQMGRFETRWLMAKKIVRARRSLRSLDRRRSRSPSAPRRRARHLFEREPDARRTGDERLERAIRLIANRFLEERIDHLLTRPVGRPPNEVRRFYTSFTYQAGSWTKSAVSSPRSNGIRAISTRASPLLSPKW
jgi:hypothetical protein